ncbi:MAG: type 1 glutamine amidotransferase domain-containing protein [Acidobacteriaceae bacterium]
MNTNELKGKHIAILATDGFEQVELTEPKKALEAAGATTAVVSLRPGQIKGWDRTEWGDAVQVDATLDETSARDYDALMLPGGVMNPDRLRADPKAVAFVKEFFASGKPVGAICHGPWILIETGFADGATLTSWPSLKTDLRNAGAFWVDREVVADNLLVTSRKPEDLPAFNAMLIEVIQESSQLRMAS